MPSPKRFEVCAGSGNIQALVRPSPATGVLGCCDDRRPACVRSPDGPGVINPTTARLQHVYDAADHATVIDARLSACVGRQQRPQPSELLLGEPETIAIHRQSPFGDRESQTHRKRNPLPGAAPRTRPMPPSVGRCPIAFLWLAPRYGIPASRIPRSPSCFLGSGRSPGPEPPVQTILAYAAG